MATPVSYVTLFSRTISTYYVRCGRQSCTKCPHGPYLYAYYRDDSTGKVTSEYLGKQLLENPKPDGRTTRHQKQPKLKP
jgi:hypothetical protein